MKDKPRENSGKAGRSSLANFFVGEIPQKQMARFAQQTPINAAATLIVSFVVVLTLLPVAPVMPVLGWGIAQAGLLSIILYRWWVRRNKSGPSKSTSKPSRRGMRHGVIFAGLSGGLWGALTLFMPILAEEYRVAALLVQAGMTAGAVATLAAMPIAAFVFILGCMLPPIIYLLGQGQMPFVGLGLMLVTFTVAMLGTTRLLFRTMLDQRTAELGQERALKENAANLRRFERAREEWLTVADAGPGFALFDQAGSLLVWNDKLCDVLLLPRNSLQRGRTRSAVLVDAAQPVDTVRGAKGGDTWYDQLLNLKEVDGVLSAELAGGRLIEVNVSSMESGYEVLIARDVTERQNAENSLRFSEARLKCTQRVAQIGSWIRDLKTRELRWSDELYQMIGLDQHSIEPDRDYFERLVHEDDIGALRDTTARSLGGLQAADDVEFRLYRVDGEMRYIRARGEIIFDQDGQPSLAMATFQDITDLRRAQTELAHAQKLEAVGQLTGGISHDFNNLLSVVIGNIELAEDIVESPNPDNEKLLSLLSRAQEAADRGSALTERLLAFSRKQELQPINLDVNGLLQGMSGLLERAMGEAIEVGAEIGVAALNVCADPSQLENAILNLCLNARDAMPEGGSIVIRSRLIAADDLYPGLAVRTVDHVAISVIDSGSGISECVRDRVFEPFFTTKEVGKGSGLGLSMVYGFARQSGGDVKIESEEKEGTSVSIYLPAVEAKPVSRAPKPVREAAPVTGNKKILVIEDSAALRELADQILSGLGYSVLLAADGPEAIELVEAGAKFDLLFTDVVLPKGMNGIEVAEKICRLRPGLKVLYTSGYARKAMNRNSLKEGAELLAKPYRRAQVAEMLQKLLDS